MQCRKPRSRTRKLNNLENKSSTLGLLVTTVKETRQYWIAKQQNMHMQHTPARSACSASGRAASWPCKQCTRDAGRPSWWSWPSCGRRAWSDHRNHSASGRNGAYPGRRGRPKSQKRTSSAMAHDYHSGVEGTNLASLVLGDLVLLVLVAVLGLAVRPAGFGNVDLCGEMSFCLFGLIARRSMSM